VDFIASGSITFLPVRIRNKVKIWVYDYKTKKEYFAKTPRFKFYICKSIVIELISVKPFKFLQIIKTIITKFMLLN